MGSTTTSLAPYLSNISYPESFLSDKIQENINPTQKEDSNYYQTDKITLSTEAKEFSRKNEETDTQDSTHNDAKFSPETTGQQIEAQEIKEIQQLEKRDAEVRAHEQAHLAVAGQYAAGGASYSYTTGPNGKRYAVSGEVPIDVSKEATPEKTIEKMLTVKKAALAPANPSSTDMRIAAQATITAAQARKEQQSTTFNSSDSQGSYFQEPLEKSDISPSQSNSRHMMLKTYQIPSTEYAGTPLKSFVL